MYICNENENSLCIDLICNKRSNQICCIWSEEDLLGWCFDVPLSLCLILQMRALKLTAIKRFAQSPSQLVAELWQESF